MRGTFESIHFLAFRNELFKQGGRYTEGLAYILIAAESKLSQGGIPRKVLHEQLSMEFGEANVKKAISHVDLADDAGGAVYRHTNGRSYKPRDMLPPGMEDLDKWNAIIQQMMETGQLKRIDSIS